MTYRSTKSDHWCRLGASRRIKQNIFKGILRKRTGDMTRVGPDHPGFRMCGHIHDVVIYSNFHQNPSRGSKFALSQYFGIGFYNSHCAAVIKHQCRRQWEGEAGSFLKGVWPPGRFQRLEFDVRKVPPKTLFGPLLARLWCRRWGTYSRFASGVLKMGRSYKHATTKGGITTSSSEKI